MRRSIHPPTSLDAPEEGRPPVGPRHLHVAPAPSALDGDRMAVITVPGERGQTTAEYALVMLGAAAIALLLAAWAAKSGAISALFDAVVGRLIEDAG